MIVIGKLEEIWEKIDKQFGLQYIPFIEYISNKIDKFLKPFHDLGINNIRVLSICDPHVVINFILKNNNYSKIFEKSWIYFSQGYDEDFRNINSNIDYILTIQKKRERYGDRDRKDLEKLTDTGDLDGDEFDDILEFKELESDQIERFLEEEAKELEKLKKQLDVLKNPSIKEKITKIILYIINKSKYLVKHPESVLTYYTLK